MLIDGQLVAFIAAVDIPASRRFYDETLGLTLVSSSPFADVYDVGGTELRVQAVQELHPAQFTALGWSVRDIVGTVERLADAGVTPARFDAVEQDEYGIWRAPDGTGVAWFHDPAGNIISIHQVG